MSSIFCKPTPSLSLTHTCTRTDLCTSAVTSGLGSAPEVTPSQPLKTEFPAPHVPKGLSYSTPSNKQTDISLLAVSSLLALALSSPDVTALESPLPKQQNETGKNDCSALRVSLGHTSSLHGYVGFLWSQ